MKVLLAGIFHESHSFTGDITRLADFRIFRERELLERAGDGSTTDGFLAVARQHHWRVIPGLIYEAMPSGVVDHAVFETFWAELERIIVRAVTDGVDGIFLVLHGAMVTTESSDPEGELLRRIRCVSGAGMLPVFGICDLHGNLSSAMGKHADALVCYRENPHVDAYDRAQQVAELLARCLKTRTRPTTHVVSAPIVWSPTGTGTATDPMKSLEELARQTETQISGVLAVSVWAGYSFADVHDAGVAFSIVTEGDPEPAHQALARLKQRAWELRREGLPHEHDLEEVMQAIKSIDRGPVLVVEPADNIGAGAAGDCTDVLLACLRHDVRGAGIIIADPQAVAALNSLAIGSCTTLSIGGKASTTGSSPVELEVELLSRSDGRFTVENRNSHLASVCGVNVNMGPSAVVRHRGVTILLNTCKTPPWDLGQWRSQGIHPELFRLIGIKGAVAHRCAYDPIATQSYTVITRGPCTSDPCRLPYRNLRRPIFPLDP